jgi:putative nucleotidyltransferase with HDIG domain
MLLAAGVGFLLSSELLLERQLTVRKGLAAGEDIAAPSRIEYTSELRTTARREQAVDEVERVYQPFDRQVGREQLYFVQQILSFVDSVRADPFASLSYQRFCLESIERVDLSAQVISDTLRLSEAEWKAVQQDIRQVLAKTMSEEIKTGEEEIYRRNIRALINLDLNEPQTAIVDEIASALVKANREYDQQATKAAQQLAAESVAPVVKVLEENEVIVRSGEIVTAEHIEALDASGLLDPQVDRLKVIGAFVFALLLAVSMSIYIRHGHPALMGRAHYLLLILLLVFLFTLLAKWGLSPPISQPYLAPVATLGMLVAALFDVRLALVAHVLVCLIVGYLTGGQLDLFVYQLAGGLVGVFALRRVNRIKNFVLAGLYVMLTNFIIVATFTLLNDDRSTLQLGQSAVVGVANGAFSAILTLGGYYLLGVVFGITTSLQLMDLARPTHPLMRELLLKAPGTYHHSIMVGNMAEQAAEAIDADALLTRVGAFYHDIGKTIRPYFFTENQVEGSNPHDLLDPETSSQIIRSHTKDGLELARKYRLPRVIRAFIAEHHGTGKIGYFYHKAVQEYGENQVQEQDYAHLGPRPQSKETAIVMMADSCEAAVHSVRPEDSEALERLIRRIVSGKIASGQLNNAPLTLREIETIISSFIDTLQGVFHTRVRYPGGEWGSGSSLEEGRSTVAMLKKGGDTEEALVEDAPDAVPEVTDVATNGETSGDIQDAMSSAAEERDSDGDSGSDSPQV